MKSGIGYVWRGDCTISLPLKSAETELVRSWVIQAGSIVADDLSKRIEALGSSTFKEIGSSKDSWDVLYVDPSDGRYSELNYPNGGTHSGGAPRLSFMTVEQTRAKYGL